MYVETMSYKLYRSYSRQLFIVNSKGGICTKPLHVSDNATPSKVWFICLVAKATGYVCS